MSVVPFGIAITSRVPGSIEHVDMGALVYDPDQQLTMTRDDTGALSPLCLAKHTDGPTSTDANTDGRNNPEWDSDVRED